MPVLSRRLLLLAPAVLTGLALAAGCGGPGPEPGRLAPSAAASGPAASGASGVSAAPTRTAEPFATIDRGPRTALSNFGSVQLAIRDDANWRTFWALHAGPGGAPPPAVDFSREQVLAALLGQRRTSGYEVEIVSIDRLRPDDALEATVVERVPDPGTPVLMVLTSPFHIVRVARSAGPVRFLVQREIGIETLAEGTDSGYRRGDPRFAAGEVAVVGDHAGWAALWLSHAPAPIAPPPVDFAREMVLAAFQGWRPSGGYAVRVAEVLAEDRSRGLVVTLELDERGGGPGGAPTNPFHFVRAAPRLVPAAIRVRRNEVLVPRDLARGPVSGYRYGDPAFAGARFAFTDDAGWRAFWSAHTAHVSPPPAAPAVDFSRETVLVALLGYRATGGHGIEVAKAVRRHDGAVEAAVRAWAPPPGSAVTMAVTNPFHAIAVPIPGAVAVFR